MTSTRKLEPNEYISKTRELFTTWEGVVVEYTGNVPVESYAVLTQVESENLARESARLRNHYR